MAAHACQRLDGSPGLCHAAASGVAAQVPSCEHMRTTIKTMQHIEFVDITSPITCPPWVGLCGNFEGRSRAEMELTRAGAIRMPFPHGESYEQVTVRMPSFLEELAAKCDGQQVLLIGHCTTL
jgi:hypothetical protein